MSLFVAEEDEAQLGEELNQTEEPYIQASSAVQNHVDIPEQDLQIDIPQLNLPLKYQREVVGNVLTKDTLLILAKGLGWEIIVSNILYVLNLSNMKEKLPNPPSNRVSLLLLLNANETENLKISNDLKELGASMTIVGGEGISSDKRSQYYRKGGVISITSRILVVDLLSGLLSPNDINGLFVLHAERVKETSNESFIANLYRDQNEWGFMKAFSDDPEAFTGFTPLATRLRNLKLSSVVLWPRFHVAVIESLSFRHKKYHQDLKTVNEINIKLSYKMSRIQAALLTCIEECLKELVRHCQSLATDYWDIENLYDDDFVQKIRLSLDSQWHRLSQTAHQLVYDLAFLKGLLLSLLTQDSLTFYQIVQSAVDNNLKRSVNASGMMNMSSMRPWLNSDVAPTITSYAKDRALGLSSYTDKDGTEISEYNLEPLPKWNELNKLLQEIGPGNRILIMASENDVVEELDKLVWKFVATGSINTRSYMVSKLRSYLLWKELGRLRRQISNEVNDGEKEEIDVSKTFKRSRETVSVRRRTRGASSVAKVNRLYSVGDTDRNPESADLDMTIMERLEKENAEGFDVPDTKEVPEVYIKQEHDDDDDILITGERKYNIIVQSFNVKTDDTLLNTFKPTHIIFYEPNLSFIRRVENYQAVNWKTPAKVYMMYYGTSAEEQRSLTHMKKEKEAFTKLIREKANLSKHFETKEDTRFAITKQHVANTRIAGGQRFQTEDDEFRVIVDMREFNSSLPNLLYRIGTKVLPCMLTVGDYILTPKICVERKAIPDLIQSFKSGRLYNQCEQMFRYYETPVLLIEFDEDKSFSFEPFSETKNKNGSTPTGFGRRVVQDDVQNKLTMLLVSFPKLKIIWSSSPYQTAQIFLELKAGEEAPDISLAIRKGLLTNEEPSLYNEDAIDLLRTIPGINASNYLQIMNRVNNLQELVDLSKSELVELLGQENGNKAYYFMNRLLKPLPN